jgi:hypothetical protein
MAYHARGINFSARTNGRHPTDWSYAVARFDGSNADKYAPAAAATSKSVQGASITIVVDALAEKIIDAKSDKRARVVNGRSPIPMAQSTNTKSVESERPDAITAIA